MEPEQGPSRAPHWEAIHHRVELVGRALAGQMTDSPGHVREVLEQRAQALAKSPTPPQLDGIEVVAFALGGGHYAVESQYVLAVFGLAELALLPGAAPPVVGVTAWRGDLLTLVDLRAALGIPASGLGDLNRVIVLGDTQPLFGVLAADVTGTATVSAGDVGEPPEGIAARREYLRGVTPEAVLVLDGQKLLELLA